MNQEPKTLEERYQEFLTRLIAGQAQDEYPTIEICKDAVNQYIEKYGADINSPTFIEDLIGLYYTQYSFDLMKSNHLNDNVFNVIPISIRNNTNETIKDVPLFNPNSVNESKLTYKALVSYNSFPDYQVGDVPYELIVNKIFYNNPIKHIDKVRIVAKSENGYENEQVLKELRYYNSSIFGDIYTRPLLNEENPTKLDLRNLKNVFDYDLKMDLHDEQEQLFWNIGISELLPKTEIIIDIYVVSKTDEGYYFTPNLTGEIFTQTDK